MRIKSLIAAILALVYFALPDFYQAQARYMVNHLTGFGGYAASGGGGPVAVSHLGDNGDEVDRTTYTETSADLGAAASDRYIVVGVTGFLASATIDTVTVAGISATQVAAYEGLDSAHCALFIAAVPSGTSGDIVLTWSASMNRSAWTWWRMTGAGSATADDTDTTNANPPDGTLNVPANGAGIGVVMDSEALGASIDSGLDQDSVNGASNHDIVSGSKEFSTEQTGLSIGTTVNGSNTRGCYASWGP